MPFVKRREGCEARSIWGGMKATGTSFIDANVTLSKGRFCAISKTLNKNLFFASHGLAVSHFSAAVGYTAILGGLEIGSLHCGAQCSGRGERIAVSSAGTFATVFPPESYLPTTPVLLIA